MGLLEQFQEPQEQLVMQLVQLVAQLQERLDLLEML
jgi:hypothetical protein